MKYGPFRVSPTVHGGRCAAIVADHDTGWDDPPNVDCYGGHLVAESVPPSMQPLLLAAPELLEACRQQLREAERTLRLRKLGPYTGDGFCVALEHRVAQLRDLVARAEGQPVASGGHPGAPPASPLTAVAYSTEALPTWEGAYAVVRNYAEKRRTVLLVEDNHVREACARLDNLNEVWSTVEQADAIPLFQQRESARVLVLPFRRYSAGVDLSFASFGVIAISEATARDTDRIRQAVGRFDRLGGKVREVCVIVVGSAP